MIVIGYMGGLGNQMFEYALRVCIAEHFPKEKICADLSWFDFSRAHEGFVLDKYFHINIEKMNERLSRRINPLRFYIQKLPLPIRIKRKLALSILKKMEEVIKDKQRIGTITDQDMSTIYIPYVFNLNSDKFNVWHFKGNWINPLYWQGYEEVVVNSFLFREELLSREDIKLIEEMQSGESIAIHIRQGDYIGSYTYDLCNEKYYKKAINELLQIIGEKEKVHIYIFSETAEINMKYIQNMKCEIVSHPDRSGVDLWLMSKCKHNIIANSTFSYWSALLNQNKQKVVIAPLYAYRNKKFFRELPVPQNWIQINNLESEN